jgi:large subunit ribosomal protein L2
MRFVSSSSVLQRFFIKSFKKRLLKASGRNFLGRICVFHQGGGRLNLYRPLDFYRRLNLYGRVLRIAKDPFRSCLVALVLYDNGLVSSVLSVDGLLLGTVIFSGTAFSLLSKRALTHGSAIPLRKVTLFSTVCAVEAVPGEGSLFYRSAGTSATIVGRDSTHGTLKGASGWLIKVPLDVLVTLGRCSNLSHRYLRIPNAGFNRRRGIRPTVRGVVKNPCDHPHGGGEGKGSPPAAQLSPWSKLTKGTPTTKKRWAVLRRRLFKAKS